MQQRDTPAAGVDVGAALRRLREERGFSIRALAEASGLAVNTLSLIEHGKTSPSVSTLQQLATTLHIPITAFFEERTPERPVVVTRAGRRRGAAFDQGRLEHLSGGLAGCPVDLFMVTLAVNASSGSEAIVHAGYEFVLCMAGRINYTVDQQEYRLEVGDTLLFEATLPHRWQNAASSEAQMLIMFCMPPEQHRPDHLHFLARATSETNEANEASEASETNEA